jgi:hypothetical protein
MIECDEKDNDNYDEGDFYDVEDNDEELCLTIQLSMEFERANSYAQLERAIVDSKKKKKPVPLVDHSFSFTFEVTRVFLDLMVVLGLSWKSIYSFAIVNKHILRLSIDKLSQVKEKLMKLRVLPRRYYQNLFLNPDKKVLDCTFAVASIDESYSLTKNTIIYFLVDNKFSHQLQSGMPLRPGLLYNDDAKILLSSLKEKYLYGLELQKLTNQK